MPLVTRRPGTYASSESLSPAEVTAPPSRTESTPLSRVGPVAVLAALAAATLLWLGHAPKADAPHLAAAAPPPREPVAVVAPAPLAPAAEPAPAAEQPAPPQAPAPERLQLEPLVLEAGNRAAVTVRSLPDGAVFFEAGQRLGTSQVRINVPHQTKRHLTALLNGYRPLNFKVDGKSETITVRLTPVAATPEPAPEAPAASP